MIAKIILATVFAGLLAVLFFKRKRVGYQQNDPAILCEWYVLYGTICMISPTLHPWYLIWLVPMLVFFQNRAWILLTGLIILSYQVLVDYYKAGVWQESPITLLIVYVPFYALLLYDLLYPRIFVKSKI